jgi:hypothetical protein
MATMPIVPTYLPKLKKKNNLLRILWADLIGILFTRWSCSKLIEKPRWLSPFELSLK